MVIIFMLVGTKQVVRPLVRVVRSFASLLGLGAWLGPINIPLPRGEEPKKAESRMDARKEGLKRKRNNV